MDPVYAACVSPNDWYRLKRALEICLYSGRYSDDYMCVMTCVLEFSIG